MRDSTRAALKSALFEASFVVFGVIFALLANEWRQERAQREHARQALGFILEELRTNRDAVGESLDYHAGLLRALAPPLESPPGIASFARGFVAPAHVYRTNWESASATGAFEQIDFPVLLRLSRVYAQQERYENQARTVGSLLYEEIYRGGTASIVANHAHLFELLRAVSYRERELLALYDETLEAMGETGGGA